MHYPSIKIEGSILSADLIDLIESGNKHSQDPKDFGISSKLQVKNEIADAWANARAYWSIFQNKLNRLDESATAVSETRNQWVIPFLGLLGYSIDKGEAEIVNNKSYAISHRDTQRDLLPIHIMGWKDDMEKRRHGVTRLSPHATLQEYLNVTEHLYGLVSNGKELRLLRDSSKLIKLSYLEFNLERMFEDELFADFAILYRLIHASRLPSSQATVAESVIERYHLDALASGSRIRDGLRDAVETAMQNIANGMLKQTDKNSALITKIENGEVTAQELHHALLRLIYRLLFLMVIEERNLIHTNDVSESKRSIYFDHYSIARLRRMADKLYLCDRRKTDLWQGLSRTLALFEESGKGRPLGIQPLGSELFRTEGISVLLENHVDNGTLLESIKRLSIFIDPQTKQARRVNYAAFDVEELGSIYESLLELQPIFNTAATTNNFSYQRLAGSERKTTGSYYTPAPLVQELIKSALVPVLEANIAAAETQEAKEQAVLQTRICDPACGSGAFLIAAAHHISFRLAQVRAGEDAHAPSVQRHAMRDVVSHCIYGVDINPLSVELCKVSLWLLAVEPGKPLSFLDHHIRCGNSLLGTNPALLEKGIPQAAYKQLTGDTKASCDWMKSLNKDALKNHQDLFSSASSWNQLGNLPNVASKLESTDDDTIEARAIKETSYQSIVTSSAYLNTRLIADTWCAAFVWSKDKSPNDDGQDAYGTDLTTEHLRKIQKNPHSVSPDLIEKIQAIATDYQFFHWHLEFPAVYSIPKKDEAPDFPESGLSGGFDVMLGNPPWERVKLQEKEFFATRDITVFKAANASARKKLIAKLETINPELFADYLKALRIAEGSSKLLRETSDKANATKSKSSLYPLCGRGDVNLYTVFAELFRIRLRPNGRMGGVFPSGIASDDTTKFFFQDLVEKQSLVSLYDFENRKAIFPGVHRSFKFCLLTAGSPATPTAKQADLAFFCLEPQDLHHPNKRFSLSPKDIALLNPNTRTCPIFRSVRDAEITKAIYRRIPVFINENDKENGNPWGIKFNTMFHMSSDSGLFHTREDMEAKGYTLTENIFQAEGHEDYLPLYEAKMIHHFDHRWASYRETDNSEDFTLAEKQSADAYVLPRYWVIEEEVAKKLPQGPEILKQALEYPEAEKAVAVPLWLWMAGYNIQQNREDLAEQCLLQVRKMDSPMDAFTLKVARDYAEKIQQDYPITEQDLLSITNCGGDPLKHLQVAKDLQSRFSPKWLTGFRDITNATNERTAISSVFPASAVSNKLPLMLRPSSNFDFFTASLSSLAQDFFARQKIAGTSMNYFILKQIPTLPPSHIPENINIRSKILELSYTANDLQPFAEDCGYDGPPFCWDEERRFQLRCELDALFFHLYLPCDDAGNWKPARKAEGAVREETDDELATLKSHFPTPRDAVAYIMETFPIVKKKDLKRTAVTDETGKTILTPGTYITKTTILDLYDSMLTARQQGKEWTSPLEIPPASFRVSHLPLLSDRPRTALKSDESYWLNFIVQFIRQAGTESSLKLLSEAWHTFASLGKKSTEISTLLSDEANQQWTSSTPLEYPREGFKKYLCESLRAKQISMDPITLLLTIPESSPLAQLETEKWISIDVALSLQILTTHPKLEEWLPKALFTDDSLRKNTIQLFAIDSIAS